jgi:hypothetical protein
MRLFCRLPMVAGQCAPSSVVSICCAICEAGRLRLRVRLRARVICETGKQGEG